jgi:hypothetical protein
MHARPAIRDDGCGASYGIDGAASGPTHAHRVSTLREGPRCGTFDVDR